MPFKKAISTGVIHEASMLSSRGCIHAVGCSGADSQGPEKSCLDPMRGGLTNNASGVENPCWRGHDSAISNMSQAWFCLALNKTLGRNGIGGKIHSKEFIYDSRKVSIKEPGL